MVNKLLNPKEIIEKEFPYFKILVDDDVAYELMLETFKKYGIKVRDFTLQVASENAIADINYINGTKVPEISQNNIEVYVINSSILNLKNSKELEI